MLFQILSFVLGSLDYLYYLGVKCLGSKAPRFLSKGFGDVDQVYKLQDELIKEISDNKASTRLNLQEKDIDWISTDVNDKHVIVRRGKFASPVAEALPKESKECFFYHVIPKQTQPENQKTTVLMMPATGEMGKGTRLRMARQLAQSHGYASVIVTAPYYGIRKPKAQTMWFLDTVYDLLLQSQAIIQEAVALAHFVVSQDVDGNDHPQPHRICFSGFSWGGAMSIMSSVVAAAMGIPQVACAAYVGSPSPSNLIDGLIKASLDMEAVGGESKIYQELLKTHLKTLTKEFKPDTPQVESMVAVNMSHDNIIRAKFAAGLHDDLRECCGGKDDASKNKKVVTRWLPGGHVSAAMMRPWLHPKYIVQAVENL